MNDTSADLPDFALPDFAHVITAHVCVITRFGRESEEHPDSIEMAAEIINAIRILSSLPGFVSADVGNSTDDDSELVLIQRWDSVGHYRKALGNFEVKSKVIPFLSRNARDSGTFEVTHTETATEATSTRSSLTSDAGQYPRGVKARE